MKTIEIDDYGWPRFERKLTSGSVGDALEEWDARMGR